MSLVFAYADTHEYGSQEDWEAGRPWPPRNNWPPVPDVRNETEEAAVEAAEPAPRRESQYIDAYLDLTASPDTRYTPWTFLKYRVHGSAWSSWSHSYYTALMRAISRRLATGTVIEARSKGGCTAYIRKPS